MKYPIAKIHVWGGFGSQLYGVYTFLLLRRQNPKRESQLVFHSSGVTARNPEIQLLSRNLPIVFVDDFSVSSTTKKPAITKSIIFMLSRIPKKILTLFGLIDSLESTRANVKTKYRTIQFRGHYTSFALNRELIIEMISLLDESGSPLFAIGEPIIRSQIGIHFRLGDLLDLKSKTYLNPERISKLLQSYFSEIGDDVVVYTDSLEDFWSQIRGAIEVDHVSALSKDPITTIQNLVRSNVFIGTNSKISIWVCVFRCLQGVGGVSYMPIEMKNSLDRQLRDLDSSGILYYS